MVKLECNYRWEERSWPWRDGLWSGWSSTCPGGSWRTKAGTTTTSTPSTRLGSTRECEAEDSAGLSGSTLIILYTKWFCDYFIMIIFVSNNPWLWFYILYVMPCNVLWVWNKNLINILFDRPDIWLGVQQECCEGWYNSWNFIEIIRLAVWGWHRQLTSGEMFSNYG